MAKLLVWATGIVFILYGVAFMFIPAEMAVFVTGDRPRTASGIIDLRATYGGMSVAVGVILLLLLSRPENLHLALICIAIVLLAMAVGRMSGMFKDGNPNIVMYLYLTVEIIVSSFALWLASECRKSP